MTLQVAVGLLNRFGMLGTYMIRTIHARPTHHFGWGGADTGPEPPALTASGRPRMGQLRRRLPGWD